jgi:protocatechuate 3,4-dioxygenase beta subunit
MPAFARTIIVLLALVVVALPPDTTAQSTKKENKSGSISGRVTSGGKPLRNVMVLLDRTEISFFGGQEAPTPKTTTDEDGRFKFNNVPAGRYSVSSFTPTLVNQKTKLLGSIGPQGPVAGVEVMLGDGEDVEAFDLELTRGGVVTGRVVDDEGKPVVNIQIVLETDDQANRLSNFRPVSSTNNRTDDRGIYRIFGVAPGRYFVSAGQNREMAGMNAVRGGASYPLTYYPGVGDRELAKPVEIKAGGETTGIDFALARRSKTFTARGRILDENNKPVPNLMVGFGPLRPGGGFGGGGISPNRSDHDGNFVIAGLIPNKYALWAYIERDSGLFSDVTPLEITDSDVAGLDIRVRQGLSVYGTVIVEGSDDPDVNTKLASLMLWMNPIQKPGETIAPRGNQIRVGADGSFVVNGVQPGKVRIFLPPYPGQKAFSLDRVEVDGVTSTQEFEIHPGQTPGAIRVFLSHGSFVISGRVEVEGEVPADTVFFIAALRPGTKTPVGQSVMADSRRRFRIEGLPAGEYDVEARSFVLNRPGNLLSTRKTVAISANVNDFVLTLDATKRKEEQQ